MRAAVSAGVVAALAVAAVPQVEVPRFAGLGGVPAPLIVPDWRAVARAYVAVAVNAAAAGTFLPIAWNDNTTRYNFPSSIVGLPSYVGSVNTSAQPSAHEALTSMGTVVTAALNGFNASAMDVPGLGGGVDMYAQLVAYFTAHDGSRIFANNPTGNGTAEWWYEVFPSAAAFMAASAVNSSALDAQLLAAAHSWADVIAQLSANYSAPLHFNSTGFDFATRAPFFNGNIIERDAAAGLAFIFMQARYRFGVEEPFATAAAAALTYLESLQPTDTVLYEILATFAPVTAGPSTTC